MIAEILLEASEILAITVTAVISGFALVVACGGKRAEARESRRIKEECSKGIDTFGRSIDARVKRVERDVRTHESALQVNGLMDGERIMPRFPRELKIHRPEDGKELAV